MRCVYSRERERRKDQRRRRKPPAPCDPCFLPRVHAHFRVPPPGGVISGVFATAYYSALHREGKSDPLALLLLCTHKEVVASTLQSCILAILCGGLPFTIVFAVSSYGFAASAELCDSQTPATSVGVE